MKKVKDIVSRKALPAVLAFTMVIGNVLPVWADDTQNNNDQTGGGYTYAAPTKPMAVNPDIITATAHRAASPVIDMLGLNATAGTGMINGSAPTNLVEAVTKPALGVWGTSLNDSPDPYYWNYFYNFYAEENSLEKSDDALRNSAQQASPAGADTNLLAEYGNISVSLSRRPDIAVGCSSSNGGNDTNGYDDQINTIRSFTPDSEYYQEGDENYDPKLVAYQLSNLTTMVTTVKDLAEAAHAVSDENPSKTWRYDDPRIIAGDYEKYIYGASAYVLSEIATGHCDKKTVALINAINEDGTYTLSDSSSMSATSRTRIVEYTDLVADNLANGLDTPGMNGQIATREQVAQADVIICLDNNNTQLSEQGIVDSLGELYNGQMIITTTPSTLYGVTMNSVENAMGLGYIVGYMYSDVLPISPVDMCAYFYQKFYHISDMDNLRTVVQTNFANAILPEGMSAELTDDYKPEKVEELLIQGMRYYDIVPQAFEDTYIAEAGWNVDWENGIGAGSDLSQNVPQTQTISGVEDLYNKTYGDDAFNLEAKTDGDGRISYEVTSGSAVSVDSAGKVTILAVGTAEITVRAAGTISYYPAEEKIVTIQVAKKEQSISGVSDTGVYNKTYGDDAFTLEAITDGDGAVSYEVTSGSAVSVDSAGKVTILAAGTAEITIKAAATDNCEAVQKVVTIQVAKKKQSISGVSDTPYSKGQGDATFALGAKTDGDGQISYTVTSGSAVKVDSSGKVTILAAGTATITIKAAATDNYEAAEKVVTIQVSAKKAQTISGVSNTYNKKITDSAFNLGAKATGGTVTYSSNKTKVATVNTSSGKVTIKGTGTATITITAPETANYSKATKTVTIKVTKAAQTLKLNKTEASYKSSVLKKKKQTFKIGAKAQGKITYKVASGKKYISVNKKTGKVTVKKGTPKGTYKITVSAAATTKYKKAASKVTITVKK